MVQQLGCSKIYNINSKLPLNSFGTINVKLNNAIIMNNVAYLLNNDNYNNTVIQFDNIDLKLFIDISIF